MFEPAFALYFWGFLVLYGTDLGPLRVDALPLRYVPARWLDEFLGNWPPGTPAHDSYFKRIVNGPGYGMEQAVRWLAGPPRPIGTAAAITRGARNG